MSKMAAYRALVRLMPGGKPRLQAVRQGMPDKKVQAFQAILRRHKALGGALLLFDTDGTTDHFVYGKARKGLPVTGETAFRLASVSKTVTAAGILALSERGLIDLDCDLEGVLPYSLRHPAAPDAPITLRMLLSHTAAIQDGRAYFQGIEAGHDAAVMLGGDSHTPHLPGQGCEYSNFGLGLAGCAAEVLTGRSFQQLMEDALFRPLGLNADYYPFLMKAPVADARRVLPPGRRPNFDGAKRQEKPLPGWERPDPLGHHLLAHGSCCMDAESLARLGRALLKPGFFTAESLGEMRSPHGSLHSRDPLLRQGLGLFIFDDKTLHPASLYGHQGMAYGAVHLLFLDIERGRGLISLTTGASEARDHIVADINRALVAEWLKHG